jgi:transcriptional regulator with XRE-family HTH domain
MTAKSDRSSFGRHVRSLRKARGITQVVLAERCDISPDTARRLEHGDFSPSLATLTKLANGLDLQLSTLFAGHELGERDVGRELLDLLGQRSPSDRKLAMELLRLVFAALDTLRCDAAREVDPDMNADLEPVISFGAHIKRLREVRRLTQEELAERSGLAADTIRRLEHQDFSPSLRTLRKVCVGLGLSITAMFNAFDLNNQGVPEGIARLNGLCFGRSEVELKLAERVLATLFDELERDPK